ncbi:MAG: tRNA pseudouridine(38-40) synthase TruA [Methanospirillum sp.]|nr:tRNA pseudouridine(38-40) synthase TruA [Methanospirillum sp.]
MAENPGEGQEVRLAFRIGYLGTAFYGSQYQPDQRTVEGEITAACLRAGLIGDRTEARLALSGRTDRGVHARCQILSFTTNNPERAVRALNGQFPPDIWATSWTEVHPGFYPRYDVINRTYRYYFGMVPGDVCLMKDAAALFTGVHDFSCFARIEPGKIPVKTIDRIGIFRDDSWCWLEITAQSFLWHMVRCIASSLLSVAGRTLTCRDLEILLEGTCKNKVKPAEPDGLILWDVTTDLAWKSMPIPGLKKERLRREAMHLHLMGRIHDLLYPDKEENSLSPGIRSPGVEKGTGYRSDSTF